MQAETAGDPVTIPFCHEVSVTPALDGADRHAEILGYLPVGRPNRSMPVVVVVAPSRFEATWSGWDGQLQIPQQGRRIKNPRFLAH